MNGINAALRGHVTQVGFHLTLGKTHIAALVYLDAMLRQNQASLDPQTGALNNDTVNRPSFAPWNQFATGFRGLEDRGLARHIEDLEREPGENVLAMRPTRIWEITPAGRLVIGLLSEAGIYQEYAAAFPAVREGSAS